MESILGNLDVPEVPVVVEFENQSLFNMGLTLVITAIIIVLAIRYINK